MSLLNWFLPLSIASRCVADKLAATHDCSRLIQCLQCESFFLVYQNLQSRFTLIRCMALNEATRWLSGINQNLNWHRLPIESSSSVRWTAQSIACPATCHILSEHLFRPWDRSAPCRIHNVSISRFQQGYQYWYSKISCKPDGIPNTFRRGFAFAIFEPRCHVFIVSDLLYLFNLEQYSNAEGGSMSGTGSSAKHDFRQ